MKTDEKLQRRKHDDNVIASGHQLGYSIAQISRQRMTIPYYAARKYS